MLQTIINQFIAINPIVHFFTERYITQPCLRLITSLKNISVAVVAVWTLWQYCSFFQAIRHFFYFQSLGFHGVAVAHAIGHLIQNRQGHPDCQPYEYHAFKTVAIKSQNLREVGLVPQQYTAIAGAMIEMEQRFGDNAILGSEMILSLVQASRRGFLDLYKDALMVLLQHNHLTLANAQRILQERPADMLRVATDIAAGADGRVQRRADSNQPVYQPGFFARNYNRARFALQLLPQYSGLYDTARFIRRFPAGNRPMEFKRLIDRLRDEHIIYRGGPLFVEAYMQPVLHFFWSHPQHASWANRIAADLLQGCVNQPQKGWLEVCSWVRMAQHTTPLQKLYACDYVMAISHIPKAIMRSSYQAQNHQRNLNPEAFNVIVRDTFYELQRRGAIKNDWLGVMPLLYAEGAAWMTSEEKQEIASNLADIIEERTFDDCCETVLMQPYWAEIAFSAQLPAITEQARTEVAQEEFCLRQTILYFAGEPLESLMDDLELQQQQQLTNYLQAHYPGHEQLSLNHKAALVPDINRRLRELNNTIDTRVHERVVAMTHALRP
jgi:hypothetical protein